MRRQCLDKLCQMQTCRHTAVLTGSAGRQNRTGTCRRSYGTVQWQHVCMRVCPGLGVATSCIIPTGLLLRGHVSFNLRMRISFRAAGLARPADSFITCLRLRTRAWSATATCRSIRLMTIRPAVHALLHGHGTATERLRSLRLPVGHSAHRNARLFGSSRCRFNAGQDEHVTGVKRSPQASLSCVWVFAAARQHAPQLLHESKKHNIMREGQS